MARGRPSLVPDRTEREEDAVAFAQRLSRHADLAHWLEEKRRRRARDEQVKPLSVYRTEELARSHECFFGADSPYHEARRRFVYKVGAPCAVAVSAPAAQPADATPRVAAG